MRKTENRNSENRRGSRRGGQASPELDEALIHKTRKWISFKNCKLCGSKRCEEAGKETDVGDYCLSHYIAMPTCSVDGCLNVAASMKPFADLCRQHYVIRDEKANQEYERSSRQSILCKGVSALAGMEDFAVGNIREFPPTKKPPTNDKKPQSKNKAKT